MLMTHLAKFYSCSIFIFWILHSIIIYYREVVQDYDPSPVFCFVFWFFGFFCFVFGLMKYLSLYFTAPVDDAIFIPSPKLYVRNTLSRAVLWNECSFYPMTNTIIKRIIKGPLQNTQNSCSKMHYYYPCQMSQLSQKILKCMSKYHTY